MANKLYQLQNRKNTGEWATLIYAVPYTRCVNEQIMYEDLFEDEAEYRIKPLTKKEQTEFEAKFVKEG